MEDSVTYATFARYHRRCGKSMCVRLNNRVYTLQDAVFKKNVILARLEAESTSHRNVFDNYHDHTCTFTHRRNGYYVHVGDPDITTNRVYLLSHGDSRSDIMDANSGNDDQQMCFICCQEGSRGSMRSLSCGHSLCSGCILKSCVASFKRQCPFCRTSMDLSTEEHSAYATELEGMCHKLTQRVCDEERLVRTLQRHVRTLVSSGNALNLCSFKLFEVLENKDLESTESLCVESAMTLIQRHSLVLEQISRQYPSQNVSTTSFEDVVAHVERNPQIARSIRNIIAHSRGRL